jgi:hypothetical protein
MEFVAGRFETATSPTRGRYGFRDGVVPGDGSKDDKEIKGGHSTGARVVKGRKRRYLWGERLELEKQGP